ncbi:MAG: Fe-S cluster assembly protein SufB, partial [Bacteroidota bacterium]
MKNQETEQQQDILEEIVSSDYKYGFVSDIDQEIAPKGLNEDSIRLISSKKNEPLWML